MRGVLERAKYKSSAAIQICVIWTSKCKVFCRERDEYFCFYNCK